MLVMMIVDVLFCIFVGTTAVLFVAVTLPLISRLPDCNLDDVLNSVRPVDLDRLESLLDPANEWQLRANLSNGEFRLQQRKRIHQTLEIMLRVAHNASVLTQWAKHRSESEHEAALARELHAKAIEVRVCALFAVSKLKTWIILRAQAWPFLLQPRLSNLRRNAGIDLLFAYAELRDVAGRLCSNRRAADCDELLRRL
jgi:hypothetical protein